MARSEADPYSLDWEDAKRKFLLEGYIRMGISSARNAAAIIPLTEGIHRSWWDRFCYELDHRNKRRLAEFGLTL